MKDSFVFYRSFYKALQKVKDKNLKADIYDAICELGLNENNIELDNEVGQIMMELIEPQIVANNEKYINGQKGGRPKTINDQLLTQLIREGKSNKTIAELLGCSLTTVKNARQKLVKNWSESQKPNVNENGNVNVNENDSTATATNNKTGETIFDLVQKEFGRVLSPMELEIITLWLDDEKLTKELIENAIKESVLNGVTSLKYVQRILDRYKRENIKTVSEAQKTWITDETKSKEESVELFDYDWLNEE